MEARYPVLFKILYRHEFHRNKDGKYTGLDLDLHIVPTRECQTMMARLGLLFRATPGAISVLYSAYREGDQIHPLKPLSMPLAFSFEVVAHNPYLVHYSDLPLDHAASSIYYLNNLHANQQSVDGEDELLLSANDAEPYLSAADALVLRRSVFSYACRRQADTVALRIDDHNALPVFSRQLRKLDEAKTSGERDFAAQLDLRALGKGRYSLFIDGELQEHFYINDELGSRKPFAVIDIWHSPDVDEDFRFADESGAVSTRTYTLRLNRRETVWKYLVGLKYRKDLDPLDLEVVSDSVSATFTRRASYRLADDTLVVPFDSGSTLLPLKKEATKGIKLIRTIAGHGHGNSSSEEIPLPNPQVANLKTGDGTIYSEVYFYV